MPFFCIQKDTRKKHEVKKIDSNSKKEFLLCIFIGIIEKKGWLK